MPHIHTNPGDHDSTTTAFIVRKIDGEWHGLLHKHRKLNMLLPVGGHVEVNENPWAAALHEIEEESGFELSQLEILQPMERIKKMDGVKTHPVPLFLQTHKYSDDLDHYHVDVGFLLITDQDPAGLPEAGESTALMWLTNQQIQERKSEMPADVAQIYDFSLTTAVKSWERVPLGVFDA